MPAPRTRPEVSDFDVRLQALYVHPVKSCAGIAVQQALLVDTGFEFDRAWMVVDEDGEFLSQRELPRMALIRQRLRGDDLVLRAPGMLALHLALDGSKRPAACASGDDTVRACDMGALAAQWFTDFLRPPGCAWRASTPTQRRLADRAWTGALAAPTAFADGFPLLVVSTASLAELNRRLALAGHAPAATERVSAQPRARRAPTRTAKISSTNWCSTPTTGPVRAEAGQALHALRHSRHRSRHRRDRPRGRRLLAGYRADARLDGALTFGMNAVIVSGVDQMLRVGMAGRASIRF